MRQAKTGVVREMTETPVVTGNQILANGSLDFRACLGAVQPLKDGGLRVASALAAALGVKPGATLWQTPRA